MSVSERGRGGRGLIWVGKLVPGEPPREFGSNSLYPSVTGTESAMAVYLSVEATAARTQRGIASAL